ncbi:hypothetical protein ACOSQ2_031558 [Xanthoceras sorbifolium]
MVRRCVPGNLLLSTCLECFDWMTVVNVFPVCVVSSGFGPLKLLRTIVASHYHFSRLLFHLLHMNFKKFRFVFSQINTIQIRHTSELAGCMVRVSRALRSGTGLRNIGSKIGKSFITEYFLPECLQL